MSRPDGRGSIPQRYLFELMEEIYPSYTVIYEQVIPSLGQRYDIFVKELGVAIEYDGRQHDHFVEHFHKDINGYISSIKRDNTKVNFSNENGIKVVRLDGDVSEMTSKKLKKVIDSTKFPSSDYSYECLKAPEPERLVRAREFRKKRYNKHNNG